MKDQKTQSTFLSRMGNKQKKITVIVTASILLAAIVFGIVWACLDHSFRYDREDLTPYIGSISISDIKNMNLSVETDISDDDVDKEIYTLLTKLENASHYAKKNVEIKENHAVYMYYELYQYKTEGTGESATTKKELIASSTLYNDKDKSYVFRIGAGDFCQFLETKMLDSKFVPEGKEGQPALGSISRNDMNGTAYNEGDTLVIKLKGTYTDGNGATQIFYKEQSVFFQPTERPDGSSDKNYFNASNELIENYKTGSDDNAALVAALKTALVGKKNGESFSFTLPVYAAKDHIETTNVTFEGKLESSFSASCYVMSWIKDDNNAGTDEKFTITNNKGSKVEIDKGSSVEFRFTVEETLSLGKETVEALADSDNSATSEDKGFEVPEGIADTDEAYAEAFEKYTFERLRDDYIANLKKNDTYKATILNALWQDIYKKYTEGDDSVILGYPEKEIESYYKTALNNYKYEYHSGSSASTLQKTYNSAEEYILVKVYGKTASDVKAMSKEEIASSIKSFIEADAKKQIARRLVVYSLAQANEITMDRDERKGYLQRAEEDMVNYYRSTYQAYVNYGLMEMSKDQIELAAKNAAKESVNNLTESYIRDAVYLEKVGELFLTDGDFPGVVFTRENSATDDGHEH